MACTYRLVNNLKWSHMLSSLLRESICTRALSSGNQASCSTRIPVTGASARIFLAGGSTGSSDGEICDVSSIL